MDVEAAVTPQVLVFFPAIKRKLNKTFVLKKKKKRKKKQTLYIDAILYCRGIKQSLQ